MQILLALFQCKSARQPLMRQGNQFFQVQLMQSDGVIPIGGDQVFAIMAEGHIPDNHGRHIQGQEQFTCSDIPHFGSAIRAGARQQLPILAGGLIEIPDVFANTMPIAANGRSILNSYHYFPAKDWSGTAQRKPKSSYRSEGGFWCRALQVSHTSVLYHAPPRMARTVPESGPNGFS